MHDLGKVLLGLLIGLTLFTFPVIYHVVSGEEVAALEIDPGVPAGISACVRETDLMRREHMQLLMNWRDEVVRLGERIDGPSGFRKSLSGTCLGCHQKPREFCFKCHAYSGVEEPYCGDCHVAMKGGQ